MEPMLLPLKDAAVALGMTEKALRHRVDRGQIHALRIGRRVYLRRTDLLEIVREGCGLSPGGN